VDGQVEALKQVAECMTGVIRHLPKGHTLAELNDKLVEMHRIKKQADRELSDFLGTIFQPVISWRS
jgi:hypothetical protein